MDPFRSSPRLISIWSLISSTNWNKKLQKANMPGLPRTLLPQWSFLPFLTKILSSATSYLLLSVANYLAVSNESFMLPTHILPPWRRWERQEGSLPVLWAPSVFHRGLAEWNIPVPICRTNLPTGRHHVQQYLISQQLFWSYFERVRLLRPPSHHR